MWCDCFFFILIQSGSWWVQRLSREHWVWDRNRPWSPVLIYTWSNFTLKHSFTFINWFILMRVTVNSFGDSGSQERCSWGRSTPWMGCQSITRHHECTLLLCRLSDNLLLEIMSFSILGRTRRVETPFFHKIMCFICSGGALKIHKMLL